MPVILKLLICFALVLGISRTRFPLSLSLLIGAVVLGFWVGQTPAELGSTALYSITGWSTCYLAGIIVLILFLSRLMEQSGHLQRIVYAFILVVKDRRAVAALVPAMIGLLPMPGGALFSAPLVKKAVEDVDIPADLKAMINYWFRHVWEYWWPLYPGFILAVGLLGVSPWKLMAVQFPLALFCVISGGIFLLLPLKGLKKREGPSNRWESFRMLLKESAPVIMVVAIIISLNLLRRILESVGLFLSYTAEHSVQVGIAVCIIMVIRTNKLNYYDIARALRDKKYFNFVFLILAIMVFKGVLSGSSIILAIKNEMIDYRIPLLLIVTLLPFISGLVTGIAVGFVGASFPVIIPMLDGFSPISYLAYAALAYSCGYMGMMLSPVHLCLLVSKDYFQAGLYSCYLLLIKLVVLVIILTGIYVFVLTRLG
ncbi:MAG: DUF401 family protein [Candidatus Auribacterota bacterium]|nr:DUF401 family protein [Candidatus Auribacterota bacterium]